MRIDCENKYKIGYSYFDKNMKMRINEYFNFSQNNTTEYFGKFGGDNVSVSKKHNAVWVVTKSKVHIYKNINWLDTLTAKSYISLVRPIKIEIETAFTNEQNELVCIANSQSCPVNISSRKIRKIDTVGFPTDIEVDNSLFEYDYQRFRDIFEQSDFVCEQKVYSQDIDYSNHVNNTVYIRYLMNSLSSDFFSGISVTDIEIHYIAEAKEGQVLRIYKKSIDDDKLRFLIKEGNRDIVRAGIKYYRNYQ